MLISRINPTPSGFLHEGNVFNFLLTKKIAQNGIIYLRIDDIDTQRIRKEYILNIFEILNILKFDYIGAKDYHEYLKKYALKQKMPYYIKFLHLLKNQLFVCECNRKALNCNCYQKKLKYKENQTSLKLKILNNKVNISNQIFTLDDSKDILIWRKNNLPSYQFSCVVDDYLQKINCIVRGKDLFNSTLIQAYIAKTLNLDLYKKAQVFHHDLLLDKNKLKLSKSNKSATFDIKRLPFLHSMVKNYNFE